MTKNQVKLLLTHLAILETVNDSDNSLGGIPESHVYLALGMNYDHACQVIHPLITAGVLNNKSHLLTKGPKFDQLFKALKEFETQLKKIA